MTSTVGRYVGHSVKRVEDPRLLTGRGSYVDDVAEPETLHVAFVRSTIARGRITELDVDDARQVAGVAAVLTGDDLNPRMGEWWASMLGPRTELGGSIAYPPANVLAPGDVRFVGDPVAMVLASSRYVAEDAAEMVIVDYDPLEPVLGLHDAADADPVHPELDSNVSDAMPAPQGTEVDQVFDSAPHTSTHTFAGARATNSPMETRGITVRYDPFRNQMDIRVATQSVHEVKAFAARITGLPESHIRAVAEDVGGGFGQKIVVMREEAAVILAAFVLGGPRVKWIEDRRENLMASNQARSEEGTVTFAVDSEGHILAARVAVVEEVGAYPTSSGAVAKMGTAIFTGPYRIPVLQPAYQAVYTNTVGKAPYRGPWAAETIFREQMIDIVAREIGIDPIEMRRLNVLQAEDLPHTLPTQMVLDRISPAETLEQAVAMIGADEFRTEQRLALDDGRLLGLGVSGYVEPSAIAFGLLNTDPAVLTMDISGKVQVRLGTGSHGHSIETTMAQVVASHLGCDLDDVFVIQGDTATSPVGPGTGGSRTAVIAGGAAQTAAQQLRDKLTRIAAHLLEANPDDLEIAGGVASVRGTPRASITLAELARTAHTAPERLPEGTELGLEVVARYRPPTPFTWSNATHACTVEVDPETGMVELLRYVVSEDCGQMINPMVVEGQIAGGVAQGIGGALFEHLAYDEYGNPLATTYLDYLLPTAGDVPDIEYGHVETMSGSLGGYKGMGEGGAIASPAAVANAVNDALAQIGATPLTRFPFTPERVLDAVASAAG